MLTWLMGAAVTFGAPADVMRADSVAAPEDTVTSGESDAEREPVSLGENQGRRYGGEPPVNELLADPIVQLLMNRDGVSAKSLALLMSAARDRVVASTMVAAAENGADADGSGRG